MDAGLRRYDGDLDELGVDLRLKTLDFPNREKRQLIEVPINETHFYTCPKRVSNTAKLKVERSATAADGHNKKKPFKLLRFRFDCHLYPVMGTQHHAGCQDQSG